ncbi:hypothetical protein Dvina_38575 [Dactylosporangium vinaceum]|uniref:Acyl-CoA dehydrogenase/oxidase C-terminal domain-containing protein n=1 Tax=Dactylosporangium vinaceum TaxID=53362 RepID=A0ABV5ML66_9ACTN|nr:hypothetical protein [Dactylosporangium vinaceum]UAB94053.1 hypothetical protein Dvina_38575 [Dactylosporangium vinaceum]
MTAVLRAPKLNGPETRAAAREKGVVAGLLSLGASLLPDALPCGPGGHALVPAEMAAAAQEVWCNGRRASRSAAVEIPVVGGPWADGDLVAMRVTVPVGVAQAPAVPAGAWRTGLLWLRLGLSEGLRRACVQYLAARRTGTSGTLLQQQLVRAALAEAVAIHIEVDATLRGAQEDVMSDADTQYLHAGLTRADRELSRLLGASGYLIGSAGETAYLSEVLAEVYCGTAPAW